MKFIKSSKNLSKLESLYWTLTLTAFNIVVALFVTPLFFANRECSLVVKIKLSGCANHLTNTLQTYDFGKAKYAMDKMWFLLILLIPSMLIVFFRQINREGFPKTFSQAFLFSITSVMKVSLLNFCFIVIMFDVMAIIDASPKSLLDALQKIVLGTSGLLLIGFFIYLWILPLHLLWIGLNFAFNSLLLFIRRRFS